MYEIDTGEGAAPRPPPLEICSFSLLHIIHIHIYVCMYVHN